MKWTDYLTDRLVPLVCFASSGLLAWALLWLIQTPPVFIFILESILSAAVLIALFWDYARRRAYYRRLLAMLDRLDEKTLLGELAQEPAFLDGRILREILRRCNKYENDRLAQAERQGLEYREYLDAWVHEIKTPITSARLMIENDKTPTTLRIDSELQKINGYVEQALYYARSTDVEKDFRVERTTLQALVAAALKTHSHPLIQAGCRPCMDGLDVPVFADTKSCAFVIGQILSNAVKYRQTDFRLRFSAKRAKNEVLLTIADNGIGIPASDLARVFDKGFTGENGRRYPKSTGIGLYLCKRLCDQMNIVLSIDSTPGKGAAVTLCFPTESYIQDAGV